MTILVTGGKGFLGKALVQQLQVQGYETIVLDSKTCDLSKRESLEQLEAIHPTFVFHLAGKTGILASFENPALYYRANLYTTQNLLEYCRKRHLPMHFVSGYVYGNLGSSPLCEETLVKPDHPYAHSKWMGEELCRFYAKCYSLPVTISRPFNIYGPLQSNQFFIPQMIHQLKTEPILTVQDLIPKRDYIFVEDVVEALIAIMKRGKMGHCYNIGSGLCFSCLEVITELQHLMGTQKEISSKGNRRPEEVLHVQADITKICSELNWSPKYSLRQGLAKCI